MDESERREVEKKRTPPFTTIDIKLFLHLDDLPDRPRDYPTMHRMRQQVISDHRGEGTVEHTDITVSDINRILTQSGVKFGDKIAGDEVDKCYWPDDSTDSVFKGAVLMQKEFGEDF